MLTILLPVDFSEGSMRTCHYAIKLCATKKARIILFHIYPDQLMIPDSSFPVGMDNDAFINTELIETLRKQSEINMHQFSEKLNEFIKKENIDTIEIIRKITGGDPGRAMQDVISEIGPELIVMGTRGDGNKGFLEGNMAEKIMDKTKIPVFAIPNSAEPIRFENVMYATNFSDNDFANIRAVVKLFEAFDTSLHVVHFKLTGHSGNHEKVMDTLRLTLKEKFPEKKVAFHLFDSEDKAESLNLFVKENKIDLITFIAHKTGILKNLFSHKIHKKDFFKLELPMLAMHEE